MIQKGGASKGTGIVGEGGGGRIREAAGREGDVFEAVEGGSGTVRVRGGRGEDRLCHGFGSGYGISGGIKGSGDDVGGGGG